MKRRTYSEKEMAEMLERAAELQAKASRNHDEHSGLTLEELEDVAAEVGLDPEFLRQAAREIQATGRPLTRKKTSATHNFVERVLEGPLESEAWEDVVGELRHRFDSAYGASMGMPGYGVSTTEQVGRTMEWKHTSMSGIETRVLVRPRGDKLKLKLSQRVGLASPTAESIFYGLIVSGLAGIITGAITKVGFIGLITFLSALVALIPLILFADKAWRRKKHRELDDLADTVTGLLQQGESQTRAEPAFTYDESPVIDDALLDPIEDKEEQHDRGKNRSQTRS